MGKKTKAYQKDVPDTFKPCWNHVGNKLQLGWSDGPISNTTTKTRTVTWSNLLENFRVATVGNKDGSYITRCGFSDNHRRARSQGAGYLLILDGDSSIEPHTGKAVPGAPDPHAVSESLYEQDITHLIYSSHSNQQDEKGHRYRVLIPVLLESQADLDACLDWIINQLHKNGILLADVKENHTFAQAWYMPRVPSEEAKKEFVFLEHTGSEPFPLEDAKKLYELERKSLIQAEEQVGKKSPQKNHEYNSPITRFNALATPQDFYNVLTKNGYHFCGVTGVDAGQTFRYLCPGSKSGSPGVTLFKDSRGTWRVHSFHGEDDPISARSQDAYGLLTMFVFDGDEDAAIKSVIKKLKSIDQKSKPGWKTQLEASILTKTQVENLEDQKLLTTNSDLPVMEGQITYFFAYPGSGKTALLMHLAGLATDQNHCVHYFHVDASAADLKVYHEIAEQNGFKLHSLLAEGMSLVKLRETIKVIAEDSKPGELKGMVFLLDTYKKFASDGDVNDKKGNAKLLSVLRQITMKGGTVIIAGHATKDPDPDGFPRFAGTQDIMDDIDALWSMSHVISDDGKQIRVNVQSKKARHLYDQPWAFIVHRGSDLAGNWVELGVEYGTDLKDVSKRAGLRNRKADAVAAICNVLKVHPDLSQGELVEKTREYFQEALKTQPPSERSLRDIIRELDGFEWISEEFTLNGRTLRYMLNPEWKQ